ncbi:MAG: hypothetical protein ACE5JU_12565 [Candidatus Binatia bacterium]
MIRRIVLLFLVLVLLVGVSVDPASTQQRDQPRPGKADQALGEAEVETRSTGRIEPEVIPPVTPVDADMVSLNFSGADLTEFIHAIGQQLRLNYIIDPRVKGTVTIFSAEPIKNEDLMPIFHQVLRINNAVAVKSGHFYRIAPLKEGKGLARPLGGGGETLTPRR